MSELLSVGLDLGTTTTQMVLSRLGVENRASAFAVPDMAITHREILYESPVLFTPLLNGEQMDGDAIRDMVAEQYRCAGISREMVDTGAIIITGETSRKENARAVTEALTSFAGDFVVATAGPHLESVLAAKGSGAADYSEKTGKTLLHMDIGGGTSNLSWIVGGKIAATWCLNVGGRLVKTENGKITYVSPVLSSLTDLQPGCMADREEISRIARLLTKGLEMAAGMREKTELLTLLRTAEAGEIPQNLPKAEVISFSGGVADCIEKDIPDFAYGDMGPVLGRAIRESGLCRGEYMLGQETIRATVIGAGCHSARLSGSTVFIRDVALPLQNLPVTETMGLSEEPAVLAMAGYPSASYQQVKDLAEEILQRCPAGPIYIALQADMAKALGQMLALKTDRPILCLDRLKLKAGDYLDVGCPVGPALPVVIKTLIFGEK